jgi:hypothetical protein
MKYRLLDFKYKAFNKTDQPIIEKLVVTKLDPVERKERDSEAKPTSFFWYAPESIPVKEAIDMFIESEVARIQKDIKRQQNLIEQMLQAKAKVVLPKD